MLLRRHQRALCQGILGAALLAFSSFAASAAGPAGAAMTDACAGYAARAVDQQNENHARKCGFSGERWSTDWQAHFDWCRAHDAAAIRTASDERLRALKENCVIEVCTTERRTSLKPPFVTTETVCQRVPR